MKRTAIMAFALVAIVATHGTVTARRQNTSPDTADIRAKTESESVLVGKGIATHDFEVIRKY